ncbi:ABC transporter permease [Alcaligenaceae bacterium]|nr:ABC transporter permease [Alcaligenaceae bacterium]
MNFSPVRINPLAMVAGLYRNRSLLLDMTHREIWGRYKGASMGLLWSLITPLLMLVVYTTVFGGIFKARWGGTGTTIEFALQLFCGMTLHGFLAECLTRAPSKLFDHANYVKKVVFPLEILPVIVVLSALFHTAIGLLILVVGSIAVHQAVFVTLIAIPAVLAPLILLCLGASWFLAAATVYLRDIAQITGLVAALLLFLAPIFYPVSMIPEAYQPLMGLNPLTVPIEQLREVIGGNWPDWRALAWHGAGSLVVAWLGYAWFQKTRKGFADVL